MNYLIIGLIITILSIAERIYMDWKGFGGVYGIILGCFLVIMGYDKIKKKKK